jgi:hypothetical protein
MGFAALSPSYGTELDLPSPALRERVAEGRVRAERSEVSESERRVAPPSPSHRSAMGPSLSRNAGEGCVFAHHGSGNGGSTPSSSCMSNAVSNAAVAA